MKYVFKKEIKAIIKRLYQNDPSLISLNFCDLEEEDTIELGKALKVNRTLLYLSLWDNKIGDGGAEVIAEALKENRTLESLNLQYNNIGDVGATALAKALKVNKTLRKLMLGNLSPQPSMGSLLINILDGNRRHNRIGDAGAKALAEALKENRTLQKLSLEYNFIGDAGAIIFGDGLRTNKTLLYLSLGDNKIGDAGAIGLGEGLKVNIALQELSLYSNRISNAGAIGLGEGLKINKALKELRLFSNRIGDAGAIGLGEGLKTNKALLSLHLAMNNLIGDAGAKALAEALKTNQTLQSLELSCNKIGAIGSQSLSEALKLNQVLKSLNLENNQVGNTGAENISEALKLNKTLQALNLRHNGIGDAGAIGLGEGLKTNKALLFLNLEMIGSPSIGAAGSKALVEALKLNKTLQSLNLKFNDIDKNQLLLIDHRLQQNQTKVMEKAFKGDVNAQVALAYSYEKRIRFDSSPKDMKTALSWYLKVATKNRQAYIAIKRLNHINSNDLRIEYEKKAKLGDVIAMSTLGLIYQYCYLMDENGNIIAMKERIQKAKYWYEKTEKTNDTLAMNQLGHMYRNCLIGQELSENDRFLLAAKFFSRAINNEVSRAADNLQTIFQYAWDALLNRIEYNDATLKSIDFNHWSINDDHIYRLCKALEKNATVKKIDLRNNKLTIKSLYYITSLLSRNKTIERIELSGNPVGEKGQHIIDGGITPFLQHRRGEAIDCEAVNLEGCRAEMVRDIFLINLPYYEKLIALNLSHLNQEHDFFFPILVQEYLKKNPSLLSLNLSYNRLTFDSLFKIASAMKENNTLMDLDVSHNEIDLNRSGVQNLFNSFKKNPNFSNIDVTANYLKEDCDAALLALVSKNADNLSVNVPSTLFYSQHYRRGELIIPSLIKPSVRFSNTNNDTWILALACHKGTQHASIFIERLRASGQHEILRCHIEAIGGKLLGKTNTIIEHECYRFDNLDNWYLDIHEVDSGTGEALLYSIRSEIDEQRDYSLIPNALTNVSKGKKINCTTWCIEHLERVHIPVNESIIPSVAAKGDGSCLVM